MKEKVRFLGLDVHAETIAVAIGEPDGELRSLGTIANRAESIRKMVRMASLPDPQQENVASRAEKGCRWQPSSKLFDGADLNGPLLDLRFAGSKSVTN